MVSYFQRVLAITMLLFRNIFFLPNIPTKIIEAHFIKKLFASHRLSETTLTFSLHDRPHTFLALLVMHSKVFFQLDITKHDIACGYGYRLILKQSAAAKPPGQGNLAQDVHCRSDLYIGKSHGSLHASEEQQIQKTSSNK